MATKKFPRSFYDCNGVLCVSCSECDRGYNGSAEDKCACGSTKPRTIVGQMYCCIGTLMPSVDKMKIRSLPRIVKHSEGDAGICFNGTLCRGEDKCAGWDLCQKGRS